MLCFCRKTTLCGNQLRSFTAAVFFFCAVTGGMLLGVEEHFDWMPPEAGSDRLRGDDAGGEQIIPEMVVTKIPKVTSDMSKYTKVYNIELKKFNISNDGTNPEETSKGINQALQDAKKAGANRIVFPKGTYLISEKAPIVIDHKNTVFDFNGAVFRINPNGLQRYAVIETVYGAENVRLTNGILRGDRDTHDYKAEKGTHEGGAGISFVSGNGIEVDHMDMADMTGDGAVSHANGTRTRPELLSRIFYSIYSKELEQGAFSDKGEKVESKEKIRSIKPYELSKCEGEFEIGYLAGYMGYPFIKGRVYQIYFYDGNMNFIEKRKCLQYKKVTVPSGAKSMHLEFNQPEVSDEPAHAGAIRGEWILRINNFRPPTDVHFHHNTLSRNRRLGMAFCGGQRWIIEDNMFENNGGTAPSFGIDFEDGSELMQNVVFRRNKFRNNKAGDLVVCAGSELLFQDNDFERNVVVWGRVHNYKFIGNRISGGNVSYRTRTGVAEISGNDYKNCNISIFFDTKGVADGIVRKAGQQVSTPPLILKNETLFNIGKLEGTYFNFSDSKMNKVSFIAGKETRMVDLRNCELNDCSMLFEEKGPAVKFAVENCKGALKESGPGLGRKK